MGLDIVAYRRLSPAPEGADPDGDYEHFVRLSDWWAKECPEFSTRMKGTAPGTYAFAERFHFGAGSYSGYSEWRDRLARLFHGKGSDAVWHAGPTPGPFVELLRFADNEGVIGAECAAKFARDFAEGDAQAAAEGGLFYEKYRLWRRAFETAADGGAVNFQ